MKRAAEESSGSDSKKSAGTGGALKGMPGDRDDKTNPIERPLHLQSVTLHFTQRTWEELGAGELKYLPLSQTPYYMLDQASKNQLLKFENIWSTMYLHQPHAKISNLLMLQDDLINQGGTPLETTAFTQACYMMTYQPNKISNYFTLANLHDCAGKATFLFYDFNDVVQCGEDYSQLISVHNYKDFENLIILPAKVDEYAGYEPLTKVLPSGGTNRTLSDTYISPSLLNSPWNMYSANMQPYCPDRTPCAPIIPMFKQITWARNLDKIALYKYGDEINIPITTNLEGIPLIKHPNNNILTRETAMKIDNDNYRLSSDFVYPSRNRPYFSRSDNLNDITSYQQNKNMKNLNHTFLTMPPIRKANGALLKQRCSFMLEQSFSITFQTVESVFDDDSAKNILNQSDGVILRPVLYGTMKSSTVDEGAFCPVGKFTCSGEKCPYDNSFQSLLTFLLNHADLLLFASVIRAGETIEFTLDKAGQFTDTIFYSERFKETWVKWINCMDDAECKVFAINCRQKAHYLLRDRTGIAIEREADNLNQYYIIINVENFKAMLKQDGIGCGSYVQQTDFKSLDRNSYVYFT